MVEKLTLNSLATALVDIPAVSMSTTLFPPITLNAKEASEHVASLDKK